MSCCGVVSWGVPFQNIISWDQNRPSKWWPTEMHSDEIAIFDDEENVYWLPVRPSLKDTDERRQGNQSRFPAGVVRHFANGLCLRLWSNVTLQHTLPGSINSWNIGELIPPLIRESLWLWSPYYWIDNHSLTHTLSWMNTFFLRRSICQMSQRNLGGRNSPILSQLPF